jgi:hypothetical protein
MSIFKKGAIIRNVSAAWSIDTEPVLKGLNINIQESKITMIDRARTFRDLPHEHLQKSRLATANSPNNHCDLGLLDVNMPHIVVSHHGSRSVQSKKILLVHRHGIDPGTTRSYIPHVFAVRHLDENRKRRLLSDHPQEVVGNRVVNKHPSRRLREPFTRKSRSLF